MNKEKMRLFKTLIIILALALLAPVALAHATTPSEASGHFTATNTATDTRTAGPNTVLESKITFTSTGTFVGTCVGTSHSVIQPDGHATMHGECTFTVTSGEGGTPTGTAIFTLQSFGDGTTFHGQFVGGHGTGPLAGLHTEGTFDGTTTANGNSSGAYSGEVHFDPS